MRECRAAVITAHNQPLEIRRVPIPALEPGALLVRIVASTLCGTDVHRWQSRLAAGDSLPIITGHEPCGIVEEIAGARTDILGATVRPGERIVWSYPACGSCYYCAVALQPCNCVNRASWGHHRVDQFPYLLGSCAEYMYVPPSSLLIKVPDEVSSASAAAAACAYRTVMHGFDRLGAVKSHESVLIQGSGPIGNFAAAVAKDHGAKQVLVVGAPANRLKVAREMGADAVLNMEDVPEVDGRVAWVRDRTEGRGADIVVQCASNAAIPEGLQMLRPGGRYVSIGNGGKAPIPANLLPGELTFLTVRSGEPRHWLQAIDFLASRKHRYPFETMISASYPLDRINDAMQAMADMSVVKAAITFQ